MLAAAIGTRVAAAAPLDLATARVSADPSRALAHAADGWSTAGSLGTASAQPVRDAALAAYHGAGAWLGLSPEASATGLRALILVVAVLGAVQVARAVSARVPVVVRTEADSPGSRDGLAPPEDPAGSWAPWVAGLLYAAGPVLVAALVRSPTDGLALAVLPWVVLPLIEGRRGWCAAASSAVWLGIAGFAQPLWALTVLVVGCLAVLLRIRDGAAQALRWGLLAVAASSWWLAALAWELRYGEDLGQLAASTSVRDGLADALAWPGLGQPWVTLLAGGALAVVLAALAVQAAGLPRLAVPLSTAGVAALLAAAAGWVPPVLPAAPATATTAYFGPGLACLALAGLLAWVPLSEHVIRVLRALPRRQMSLRGGITVPTGLGPGPARGIAAAGLACLVPAAAVSGFAVAVQERAPVEPREVSLWAAVADWSSSAPPGRVLVVPPREEESAALAHALGGRPWVSRTSVPTSGAAATAALDDVLWRLARGLGGPGTEEALHRLGISYVLVRTDGTAAQDRGRPAALIREALREQDAVRTAVLSEDPARGPQADLVDLGIRTSANQVEVWKLDAGASARIYSGDPVEVAGAAGAVADLVDAGLSDRALHLVPGTGDIRPEVLSDSARRRDVDQRVAADPYGRDLGADDPRSVTPVEAGVGITSVRGLSGARSVSASSSAADLGEPGRRPGSDAVAAVDGNAFTSWSSARGRTVGEWWEVELDEQIDLTAGTVQFLGNPITGFPVSEVHLETDRESVDREVGTDGSLTLGLSQRATRLKITVTSVRTSGPDRVGIAELSAPGLSIRSHRVVSGRPIAGWVLAARPGSHDRCVPAAVTDARTAAAADLATVCSRELWVEGADTGTLRRSLVSPETATLAGAVWARAAETDTSAALADRLASPTVTATGSSVAAADLETRAQAAADGDPSTAWRPAPADTRPALTLLWRRRAEVAGLQLVTPPGSLWSRPTRVLVEPLGQPEAPAHELAVRADGTVSFPPVRTRSLRVTVLADTGVMSRDSYAGAEQHVPVALGEVQLLGGPASDYDATTVHDLACGLGPDVVVGRVAVQTELRASAREIIEGRTLHARFCSPVEIPAGGTALTVPASFEWTPLGVVLAREGAGVELLHTDGGRGAAPLRRDVPLDDPLATTTVPLGGGGPRVLSLTVPRHPGWRAEADGTALEPVTIDGWAQAWLVPEGATAVELRYAPGTGLGSPVLAGSVAWLLPFLVALSGSNRRRRSAGLAARA